jgi:hypothetical protein
MSVNWEDHEYQTLIERADDYERDERRKRLERSQPLAWYVWPSWIVGGVLVVAWIRILYLVGIELFTWLDHLVKVPQWTSAYCTSAW